MKKGTIYVWTKNFTYSTDGKSLCLGEFVWYVLAGGDLYSHSGDSGTCGGFIDPSLKQPTHLNGDIGQVVAGGGDGTIVGGTGKFAHWTGTYTDRVFVEFNFTNFGANYYDQLFWSINRG